MIGTAHEISNFDKVVLVVIGDKLGLYKALANTGPLTPAELAERTGTAERYVREWLAAQAAGGYVMYDPTAGRYSLSEEQAFALADENSPAFMPGAFLAATAAIKAEPKITEAFRTGAGVGWHEHDPGMFHGVARFFRPYYAANLVSSWIPALAGVEERLREGIRVADVGWAMDYQRYSWHRPTRTRPSSGLTFIFLRSSKHGRRRTRPGSQIGCASKSPRRRITQEEAMTL